MKHLKNVPNLVMWHDGMALCPQHFQQGFARSEGLFQYYQSNFSQYSYGIINLELDESLLASGLFKITALEVIFPDGFAYIYDSSVDSALELDLTEYQENIEKHKEAIINIALPAQSARTNVLNTQTSRFKTVTSESSFDEVTGENDILIPRLRPNVRLELERLSGVDLTAVPLATVVFQNEMFKLKPYAPPCLVVKPGIKIWETCWSVTKMLRHKIQTLIEDVQKVKQVSNTTYTFDRYFFLRNVKDSLLRFEVCLRSEQTHPFQLFIEFVEMYSKIISTDLDVVLPPPPTYDHHSILDSFEKLKESIVEFIERETPTDFNIYRLNSIGERYEYKIDSELLFDGDHVLLGFRRPVEVTKDDFKAWIRSLLICNQEQFEMQYDRRTLGFGREIVDRYQDLLPQRNMFLVLVTLDRLFPKNGTLAVSPILGSKNVIKPDDAVIYGKR